MQTKLTPELEALIDAFYGTHAAKVLKQFKEIIKDGTNCTAPLIYIVGHHVAELKCHVKNKFETTVSCDAKDIWEGIQKDLEALHINLLCRTLKN